MSTPACGCPKYGKENCRETAINKQTAAEDTYEHDTQVTKRARDKIQNDMQDGTYPYKPEKGHERVDKLEKDLLRIRGNFLNDLRRAWQDYETHYPEEKSRYTPGRRYLH